MKIAFIGQKGITMITGGVERRVHEVSTRMAQEGHEVFVYARKNHDKTDHPQKYHGVHIIYLPTIALKNFDAIVHTFLASVHAIFQSYDVIHYQAPGPSSLCWIVRLFRPDVALVATFNSQDQKHQKWGWFAQKYLAFGEWVISIVPNRTIVVSEILRDFVRSQYGKDAIVVHNGAYVVKSDRTDFIAQYGLEKSKYFLTVSRFVRHKGLHYLINAFKSAKLKGLIPADFKLVLMGGGAYTDDYVAYIRELSENRSDIIFLGSQSDQEHHAQVFSHAFAYVQPSEAEGLSNSLLEALGHGLVTIVSDIPENTLPVAGNGLVFANKNVEDLESKMVQVVSHGDAMDQLRENARRNTAENYNWQNNVAQTLALYKDILLCKKNIKTEK